MIERSDGAVVVINGGSRGIGAECATLAAALGWRVCVGYVGDQAGADHVIGKVEAAGSKGTAVHADCTQADEMAALFDAAAGLGRVAGLVNTAGFPGRISRFADVPVESMRRVAEVNLIGTAIAVQKAIPFMSARTGGSGGSIVNVSSMAAVTGSPGELVFYAATKGGIETLTRGLARELAHEGIRVNAVSPGIVATEMHHDAGDAGRVERYGARAPMGRPGRPDEVAPAILWLLSDAASYVTATVLPVAGGL